MNVVGNDAQVWKSLRLRKGEGPHLCGAQNTRMRDARGSSVFELQYVRNTAQAPRGLMYRTQKSTARDRTREPATLPRLEPKIDRQSRRARDGASSAPVIAGHSTAAANMPAETATPTTQARHWFPFLEHLQDRKVVRWMMAYVGVAWMVLQAVDVLSDIWNWSLNAQKAVCLALILGFLPALVLAWHHGERGRQRMTGLEVLLLAGLLLGSGAVLWRVWLP